MLKIKEGIDLKELEKYGFEYFENGCGTTGYSIKTDYGYYVIIEKDKEHLGIKIWERRLPNGISKELLYDLIKADLVEKVNE